MDFKSRFFPLAGQFLIVVTAFFILQSLLPGIHPLPETSFKITKSEAIDKAVNLLDGEIPAEKLVIKVSFLVDKKYFKFQQNRKKLRDRLKIQPFQYWNISLISSDKKSTTLTLQNKEVKAVEDLTGNWYTVQISPEGKILSTDFKKARENLLPDSSVISDSFQIPDERLFTESRRNAFAFLSRIGVDTTGLSLKTEEVKRDSLGRSFQFGFTRTLDGFKIQHDLQVTSSNKILNYNYTIPSLEAGSGDATTDPGDVVIGIMAVLIFILLILFHIIYLIQFSRKDQISFKISLPVVYLVATVAFLQTLFSMWNSSILIMSVSTLFITLFYAGAVFLMYTIGDALARQEWNEKLMIADQLRQGIIFTASAGKTIMRGFFLGILSLSVYTLSLYIYVQYFDGIMDSEQQIEYSFHVLFPVLVFSLASLNKAIFSELFFRLTGLSLLKRWLKTNPKILLAGILFAPVFVHPEIEPASGIAKFIIFLLPTLLFISFFLRHELVTTIIGLFVFEMLRRGIVFINTGEPVFHEMGITILFILILLFLYALIAVIVKRRERLEIAPFIPDYIQKHKERERLIRELEIARTIQQQFLPGETPEVENFRIAAYCRPAWEVGGDYFDFFAITKGQTGIAIGDVSNKGVSAAFYMTMVKGFLKALSVRSRKPSEILSETNSLFYENVTRGNFISMIFGILDGHTGEFTFARAGHNPVLLLFGNSNEGRWLIPKGVGIGLVPDKKFRSSISEEKIKLHPGDVLILYTDGYPEAMNEQSEEFGEENLQKFLRDHVQHEPDEIIKLLEKRIAEWEQKQTAIDDRTIIIIKRL